MNSFLSMEETDLSTVIEGLKARFRYKSFDHMGFSEHLTDRAVVEELGRRLAAQRIESGRTQAALAQEAGVSRATVEKLESGRTVVLPALIRVLRVLGLLDRLDLLVPEPAPSPLDLLERRGRPRKRVRARTRTAPPAVDGPGAWTWGTTAPGEP